MQKLISETFNNSYKEEQFRSFIDALLYGADFKKAQQISPLPSDFKDFIRSAKRICKYEYDENGISKTIDVLAIKLKRHSSVERARAAQRNFVARYLNGSRNVQKDAALVAFLYEDEKGSISPDWRFSFVQMTYKTEFVQTETGIKINSKTELTPAKRFSFLVGENEHTHTAQQQLKSCLEKAKNKTKITIEDLSAAFDIEKVSDEFFEKYKELFQKLADEIKRLYEADKNIKKDFNAHNINIEDFAKKTLGQLVFLYFIQKKGWLGVKQGQQWGSGDKKFLRNAFDKKYRGYENFFNDILEHLFYEALAKDRTANNDCFALLNCRIPFLNGGLFEPVNGYEWQNTNLAIDNAIFKEIFDVFDLYNFTVKEDEPLEKEVAIDPEMLGKVFENLLPENIRKGNGAYYTPRPVVYYMCQESLISCLDNKVNGHKEIIPRQDIESLIRTGTSVYKNKTRDIAVELPQSIKDNAKELDRVLAEIKICDPAIGSGAFPVGIMNELVRARAALSEYIGQPERTTYELKRNAVENCIYGVDLDGGAVEIAKLRLWLSLVVDEENISEIKPLPNLDYKIMQGNSLISSYEGIDFDDIAAREQKNQFSLFAGDSKNIIQQLTEKQRQLLNSPGDKGKAIKQEIEDLIVRLVKEYYQEKAQLECRLINFYEDKIRDFAQNREKRNFFPWKLFFADVFANGGFDIVIANPPYVKARSSDFSEDLKDKLQKVIQKYYNKNNQKAFPKGADLLIFFFELSFRLLKMNGINTFITENSWLSTDYGRKFQDYLLDNINVQGIIDSDYKYFKNVDINTVISFFKKKKTDDKFPVQFFHCHENLAVSPCNTIMPENNDVSVEYNVFQQDNFLLRKYKWGFLFSTDSKLINILEKICKKQNESFARKISIGQGLNITKDKIIRNFNNANIPYFTSENGSIYSWTETETYVSPNTVSKTRKIPLMILPRGLGTHFCCMNELSGYSSSYVEIYEDSPLTEKEKINLWIFCNSSLLWLLREFTGRCNLGGGMLKAEATDLKSLPLCFDFKNLSEMKTIYSLAKHQKVSSKIEEAVNSEVHKRIDKVVFEYFGLTSEISFVVEMLINRFNWRNKKSRSI
jgi:hypothetical protein